MAGFGPAASEDSDAKTADEGAAIRPAAKRFTESARLVDLAGASGQI